MRYVWIFVIVFLLNFIIGAGTYILFPAFMENLTEEDLLIENVSVILFLAGFVLGLILLARVKRGKNFIMLIIISFFGMIGFLDELSFGERIFDLSMPELYGVKIDAIHDLLFLCCKIIKQKLDITWTLLLCFSAGSFIVISAIIFTFRNKLVNFGMEIERYPPYILMIFFGCLILAALIIDLDVIQADIFYLFEELFELNAAVSLIFSALCVNGTKEG